MNLKPIPGTKAAEWEYTLDGMSVHHRAPLHFSEEILPEHGEKLQNVTKKPELRIKLETLELWDSNAISCTIVPPSVNE